MSGWAHYEDGSEKGSRYIVIDKKVTFLEGQEECRKRGGHLAHINTIREQVYLEDFLKQEIEAGGKEKGVELSELGMYALWEICVRHIDCHYNITIAPKGGLRLMKVEQIRNDCQKSTSIPPMVDQVL